jgi:hypothetical protein
MAWLGETLTDQSGATRAPRRTKDLIEERLFERRRPLFSDLSVVLFDTTSLMFTGSGGESLAQHGVSKDHRPDLHQVVVGVVLDEAGRSARRPGRATPPPSKPCCRSSPGCAIASVAATCAWSPIAA